MKKKIIITSFILTLAMASTSPSLAAKTNEKETEIKENVEDRIKETYIIKEINDDYVILNKKGDDSDLVSVPKENFKHINLEIGKEVSITSDGNMLMSDPGQFAKIYKIEEANDSMDDNKISEKFIMKEINKEAVTVEKEGSEGELYNLAKKYFEKGLSVGDRYEISHNDIVMNSYPAQFNKIYEVRKLEKEDEKINEASDKGNTKADKNPKTGISPALLSLSALTVSLAGLKINKKK